MAVVAELEGLRSISSGFGGIAAHLSKTAKGEASSVVMVPATVGQPASPHD